MINEPHWNRCIHHRGAEVISFLSTLLSEPHRRPLLVGGAGFDPRSVTVCRMISEIARARTTGVFIRETRPNPATELLQRAENNQQTMMALLPDSVVREISIFASDGAVVGGREIVKAVETLDLRSVTDIFVDVSALSTGVVFPLVRFLLARRRLLSASLNLHLIVTNNTGMDEKITAIGADAAATVHGFKGQLGLHSSLDAAKLWLPQLVGGQSGVLQKLYSFINPDYVCPILPFPASAPRRADKLVEHYASELESWGVDARDILYAAEDDPLDLYRTVLRIHDAQTRVFQEVGGSVTVISPLGSKMLAIGSLMAAIERNFPVAYVESISYSTSFQTTDKSGHPDDELVHVWLEGEAYKNAI